MHRRVSDYIRCSLWRIQIDSGWRVARFGMVFRSDDDRSGFMVLGALRPMYWWFGIPWRRFGFGELRPRH